MGGLGLKQGCRAISVTATSPHVGAEIGNIDLTRPLNEIQLAELRRAFTDHLVLFFRGQEIGFEDQVRLGEYFGPIHIHVGGKTGSASTDDPRVRKLHVDVTSHRISGNFWHSDQSCAGLPPLGSILYLHTVPSDGGGDTLFASMYAAYDALSERMKRYLAGLTAIHDGVPVFGAGSPQAEHPVIVRHPESGRKLIYANPCFTARIKDVPTSESDAIIKFLTEHTVRSEWTCRFRWRPHSIAFWDNRCTQHRAISDYLPEVRSGYRVQIQGLASPAAG